MEQSTETKTNAFREFHDSFKALGKGRMVFRSGWIEVPEGTKMMLIKTATYRKPKVEGEVKGKWQRKAAKRARHNAR